MRTAQRLQTPSRRSRRVTSPSPHVLRRRQQPTSSGTIRIPPPTPKSALKRPATRPMKTSRTRAILEGDGWRGRARDRATDQEGSSTASPTPAGLTSRSRTRTSDTITPTSVIAAPTQNAFWNPSVSAAGTFAPDSTAPTRRRGRHGGQDRDADGTADLLGRVDQPGREAGLGGLRPGEGGDRQRHESERHAEADDEEAREAGSASTTRRPRSA